MQPDTAQCREYPTWERGASKAFATRVLAKRRVAGYAGVPSPAWSYRSPDPAAPSANLASPKPPMKYPPRALGWS